mmetsp:Transcript_32131/g.97153  ORF Transcript_32131/g.97153 Transcript_32131/m.97153 type:complete len:302 (-) Transcript_32131:133-1038(-)
MTSSSSGSGAPRRRGTPRTSRPRASRSPRGRSAWASPTPSGWPPRRRTWARCTTSPACRWSTTTRTASWATAACRRGSRTSPAPTPATSASASSSPSGTTTASPSTGTRSCRSPRTCASATRRTGGRCCPWRTGTTMWTPSGRPSRRPRRAPTSPHSSGSRQSSVTARRTRPTATTHMGRLWARRRPLPRARTWAGSTASSRCLPASTMCSRHMRRRVRRRRRHGTSCGPSTRRRSQSSRNSSSGWPWRRSCQRGGSTRCRRRPLRTTARPLVCGRRIASTPSPMSAPSSSAALQTWHHPT